MADPDEQRPTPPAEPPATSPKPAPGPPPAPAAASSHTRQYTAEHTGMWHGPAVTRERRARHMGWRSQDVLRAAALVIAMYLALRLLWFAQILVLTAFLGILFGLAVTAGVDRLERWRVPRGLGAALITFGAIGAIVGFFALSAPTLREQSRELRTKLPEAIDKAEQWLEQRRGGVLGAFLGGSSAGDSGTAAVNPAQTGGQVPGAAGQGALPPAAGATGVSTERPVPGRPGAEAVAGQPQPAGQEVEPGGGSLRDRVIEQLAGARRYLFGFVTSTLTVVGGLILVLFLTIYVAADPQTYHDGLMHLFPHRSRQRAGEVLTAMATALRKWLVTQLIAMIAIGVVTTVTLLLLGVPAAFPLGVLAGLLEFIPTVGPIISAVPAIAMGFAVSPEKALWVAVAYIAIQQLENHILIPILMKEGVDLPPALTIMSQALFALVFGFLGLLVAVPLLAAGMVAVKMLYVEDVVGDQIDVLDADDDD